MGNGIAYVFAQFAGGFMATSMISYIFPYEDFLDTPELYAGGTPANKNADFYTIFSYTVLSSFFIYLSFMFYANKKSLSKNTTYI